MKTQQNKHLQFISRTGKFKFLLATILCICFTLICGTQLVVANEIDSLKTILPSLKGIEKLDAYNNLCNLYFSTNQPEKEFAIFQLYEQEARRQRDVLHEGKARTSRLYAFYNYNMPDSLKNHLATDLPFLKSNQLWELYFSCRSLLIERYIYDNKLQSAIREANAIYDEAISEKNAYGLGISTSMLASVYQAMERNQDAAIFFKQAEKELLPAKNTGQLHNLYCAAWQSFVQIGAETELQAMVKRWQSMLDVYTQKMGFTLEDMANYYIPCYLVEVHLFLMKNDLKKAGEKIACVERLAKGNKMISQLLYLREKALYEEALGNYKEALSLVEERLEVQRQMGNELTDMEVRAMKARLLVKMGQTKEALGLYDGLLADKDSLYNINTAMQLDDLSTLYKVDMVKAERNTYRLWMLVSIGGCAGMLLLFGGTVYFNRMLKKKNRVLYEQIVNRNKMEQFIEEQQNNIPEQCLSPDEILFTKIQKLLQTPEILSDPNLDRDYIARKLSSNRTYISSAIKTYNDGLEFRDYINRIRLKQACRIFNTHPDLSVDEVSEMCGFNSRASFYRSFKRQYGMPPGEYRKMAFDSIPPHIQR